MTPSNALTLNTKHILLNNLGSKQSVNEIWPVNKFFIKTFYEKSGLETSSRPFLIFKESSVERILRKSTC